MAQKNDSPHQATIYKSPEGFHRHKCDKCRYVWEHSDQCICKVEPHTCPNCGVEQWYVYNGAKSPAVSSFGECGFIPKKSINKGLVYMIAFGWWLSTILTSMFGAPALIRAGTWYVGAVLVGVYIAMIYKRYPNPPRSKVTPLFICMAASLIIGTMNLLGYFYLVRK